MLKMSQFFHGLHTNQTCHHPLSIFGILWTDVYDSVPVPANIQQLRTAIEEEWDNNPQATINSLINSTVYHKSEYTPHIFVNMSISFHVTTLKN
jgi:hypothetical protein